MSCSMTGKFNKIAFCFPTVFASTSIFVFPFTCKYYPPLITFRSNTSLRAGLQMFSKLIEKTFYLAEDYYTHRVLRYCPNLISSHLNLTLFYAWFSIYPSKPCGWWKWRRKRWCCCWSTPCEGLLFMWQTLAPHITFCASKLLLHATHGQPTFEVCFEVVATWQRKQQQHQHDFLTVLTLYASFWHSMYT